MHFSCNVVPEPSEPRQMVQNMFSTLVQSSSMADQEQSDPSTCSSQSSYSWPRLLHHLPPHLLTSSCQPSHQLRHDSILDFQQNLFDILTFSTLGDDAHEDTAAPASVEGREEFTLSQSHSSPGPGLRVPELETTGPGELS